MRTRLLAFLVVASLAAAPAWAQETRGNINGTVQDSSGVIPGATVTITNVDTGQTQTLVTNSSGYFEAPLLQAGPYRVTRRHAELQGADAERDHAGRRSVADAEADARSRSDLRAGRRVGEVAAARHDVGVVRSELRSSLIAGLPMASNMPILLARFAQGVVSPTTQVQVISGQIDGPTNAAAVRPRRRRRLQLHDRRRHQRRQQPAHRQLAERRHDPGDARRDVELRCRPRGTAPAATIAMMTRAGSELAARHRQLPVLDQQDQLAEPAAEAGVRAASRNREDLRGRLREQHRDHPRRAGRDPAGWWTAATSCSSSPTISATTTTRRPRTRRRARSRPTRSTSTATSPIC